MSPLLIVHVGAGAFAILTGAVALSARKGERLHRAFGTIFVAAMLVMSSTAAYLSYLIQPQTLFGSILTFYLVLSAWVTVRRRENSVGLFERIAPFIALGCAAGQVYLGVEAIRHPASSLASVPVPAYFGTAVVGALAAALDFRVVMKGGLSGVPRIARHLWRMCVASFEATGAFFIGQQKVMPQFMHGSPILLVLGAAPLAFLIFWMIRVRLPRWATT